MKNQNGIIGILILITIALIVGAGVTYWYVQKDVPEIPGLDIQYNEVQKDGGDVPYQSIVKPEPAEPNYKVYSDTVVSFQYPKDWVVIEEHTGLVIQGRFASSTATSTIVLSSAGGGFVGGYAGEGYGACLTATPITIQGKDTVINFVCNFSKNVTSAIKDIIRVVVDTGHSFELYGTLSKKDTGENRAKYMEVFTQIATSLNFTN